MPAVQDEIGKERVQDLSRGKADPEAPATPSAGIREEMERQVAAWSAKTGKSREAWERALGAIEPSHHAPLGAIERGAADFTGLDPALETIVYCAVGVRSLRALATLRERHGFRVVTSLRGGYKAWAAT